MSSVAFRSVGKTYPDGTQAVSEVDLEIEDGEFVVFVGPSGCGKSTLLRMLAGLEEVTEGSVLIGEAVVNDVRARDRDIAMVFQNYALYPQMTVARNIGFALKQRKVPKEEVEERVLDAARTLDLVEYLHRKPGQLSGGQRQRVAMGRAIVRDPKVLLLDEPLSNLDAKLRVQMRSELARLHARLGTTTIFVTHDQIEAMTLGDRVAVFSRGRLQQFGAPRDLYHAPRNIFVAGFIGSPAMNFMSARLTLESGSMTMALGSSSVKLSCEKGSLEAGRVIVGVRPEDLEFRPANPGELSFRARSVLVEHVEPESYVEIDLLDDVEILDPGGSADRGEVHVLAENSSSLLARVKSSEAPASGIELDVAVCMDRIHLFSTTSGEAL